MEAYSFSSSSANLQQNSQEAKSSLHTSIHSIRKSPAKPWKKPIAPMPPTRPRVYKVDPVNFRDFVQKLTGAVNDCNNSQSQWLKRVAPPPVNVTARSFFGGDFAADAPLQLLPSAAKTTPMSVFYKELMSEISDAKPLKTSDCGNESNTFGLSLSPSSYILKSDCGIESNTSGLSLSPSSYNWYSAYPLLSPGSLFTAP